MMTRQHTICLNKTIFHAIIANSSRTRGAKHSHPILITRLCRTFLPDAVFDSFDRVFVTPERPTSSYNSCLHAVWTPSAQPENVPVASSSAESFEERDDPAFWQQDPWLDEKGVCKCSRCILSNLRYSIRLYRVDSQGELAMEALRIVVKKCKRRFFFA